jgi:hypothetical protein
VCLLILLALIAPRVVLVVLWFFSNYLGRAFGSGLILPVLGFFFLPLTTLAYAFDVNSGYSFTSGLGLVLMILAFLVDIGIIGGGRRHYRSRYGN